MAQGDENLLARARIVANIRRVAPNGVIVGLSGGIDSTVVAYLCVEALGPTKVAALLLPSDSTPLADISDAEEVAERLRILSRRLDITSIVKELTFGEFSKKTIGNIKARVRMTMLYALANETGRLVVGTGDFSEHWIGFFTKYGDGGADFEPIGDLTKTEVRELGRELGVPPQIIGKRSSPRLWEGHDAEEEIGLTYDQIDRVIEMHRASQHKRETPPTC